MKWPVEEFADAIYCTGHLKKCVCLADCKARRVHRHPMFRVHWRNTELVVKDDTGRHTYTCKWAPSYVGLHDIFDRDLGVSILTIIQRREGGEKIAETYSESLLREAFDNPSDGLVFKAPGRHTCQDGAEVASKQFNCASEGIGEIVYLSGVPTPRLEYPTNRIFGCDWQPSDDDGDDDDDDSIPLSVRIFHCGAHGKCYLNGFYLPTYIRYRTH
jgi:hypothetical protein